jgi:hypothetical protein
MRPLKRTVEPSRKRAVYSTTAGTPAGFHRSVGVPVRTKSIVPLRRVALVLIRSEPTFRKSM